jgi:hypothetical protein
VVGRAVDPKGQPGHHRDASASQVATELGGDVLAVVGRRAGADDGDPRPIQGIDVASGEQQGRRLVVS